MDEAKRAIAQELLGELYAILPHPVRPATAGEEEEAIGAIVERVHGNFLSEWQRAQMAEADLESARRELEEYRDAAVLVVGNRFPMRPHEHERRARGEGLLATLLARQMQPSPTPRAHPRDEAPVLAHEARGAVSDEEREAEGGPRGDEVG